MVYFLVLVLQSPMLGTCWKMVPIQFQQLHPSPSAQAKLYPKWCWGSAQGWAYTPRTRNTLMYPLVCPSKSAPKEKKLEILNNVPKPNTDHFVLNLSCCVVFPHEGRIGMHLKKSKLKLWNSWCLEYKIAKCQILCLWMQRSTQCI